VDLSYEEFGSAFVHEAVAPARISAVVRAIAGEVVTVGPIKAGPGGMATATAEGRVAEPIVEKTSEDPLVYIVRLPVDLAVDVNVGGTHHHYTAEADIKVGIRVRLQPPLSICIEPKAPTHREVSVKVHARGLQAKILGRVGDIDNELRHEIAAYVKERIEADGSQFANIDLRELILDAWPTG
jgi:hypothetical protein